MRHRAVVTWIVCIAGSLAAAGSAHAAETIYGLTASNKLVTFASDRPGLTSTPLAISGLQAGEDVVGVDFRPATNQLYAVGSSSRLYLVDTVTGVATQVGAQFATPLSGTSFGVDFNPAADRLRIVSSTGQNLRVNPSTAAVTPDTALNPGTPAVEGAAYTNAFPGTTLTTLYDIDPAAGTLSIQNPPNNGTLATVGTTLFAGQPTVTVNAGGDFDIVSRPGDADLALAVLNTTIGGVQRARLHTIDLLAGTATLVGNLPAAGADLVEDIAIAPDIATFVALTNSIPQQLVQVRADRPGVPAGTATISGLQAGEKLVGIDTRPATGELYGVGSTSRVYALDPATGAATQIGSGTFTPALSGASFGIDVNPVPDRIRMISDADFNGRFTPTAPITNGGLTAAGDSALTYAAGDPNAAANPNATAAAYTNSFAGAAVTTLFDIDTTLNILATQNPPNDGLLNTVGALTVDPTDVNGYEIVPKFNHGYAALQLTGETSSKLYAVNAQGSTPGAAVLVGSIGLPSGTLVGGLTVHNSDRIAFSVAGVRVSEGGAGTVLTVQRSSTGSDVPAATVAFATADGTASAGADYTATNGTLSFGPGETVKSIGIALTGDATNEPDEAFSVTLSAPTGGAALGAPRAATVTIDDDDAAVVTPPPPPPPPAVVRVAPTSVSLTVKPARDRTRPYVFEASGQVKLPAGTSAAACAAGKVTLRLKRATGTVVARTVTLDPNCRYSQKLTHRVGGRGVLRSPRTLRVTARFAGTAQLLPRSAATKTVKAG